LRKNKREREIKNQFVGMDFFTSIPYIEKKWKGESEKSTCWSCYKIGKKKLFRNMYTILAIPKPYKTKPKICDFLPCL